MSIGLITFSAHMEIKLLRAAPAPEMYKPFESKIVFIFSFEEYRYFSICEVQKKTDTSCRQVSFL